MLDGQPKSSQPGQSAPQVPDTDDKRKSAAICGLLHQAAQIRETLIPALNEGLTTKAPSANRRPVWNNATPEQIEGIKRDRDALCDRYVPTLLWTMVDDVIGEPVAAKIYLDRFLKDAGNPTDPVERALLEQFAITRLRLTKLTADASTVESLDGKKMLNAAATRLFGEFQKSALIIKQYREPLVARMIIQQQNLAHEQQIQYTHQTGSEETRETLQVRDSKLGGNGEKAGNHGPGETDYAQPPTGGRWSSKPLETIPVG
jgi:hypothetical protein